MERDAGQPSAGPPVLSEDGLWLWDGTRWVPRLVETAYPSAEGRARVVTWLFGGWIASAALFVVAELGRINIASAIINGTGVTEADATASDNVVRVAALLNFALFVGVAIVFLMWLHRVVANNQTSYELRFTPGWAVGWWFIPFANLVQPVRVMNEAWRAADPSELRTTAKSRASQRFPVIIAAWWALYLLGNLVELGARGGVGNSAPALRDHAEVELVSLGISTAAALLAIAIVVRLTRRQAQKFAALSVQPRVE